MTDANKGTAKEERITAAAAAENTLLSAAISGR